MYIYIYIYIHTYIHNLYIYIYKLCIYSAAGPRAKDLAFGDSDSSKSSIIYAKVT